MKPRSRYSKNAAGVARIQRDNYGPKWYNTVNEVQNRDGNECMACGVKSGGLHKDGSKVHMHTHHARKLSRGGTTTKANLVTICDKCHEKRHSHM